MRQLWSSLSPQSRAKTVILVNIFAHYWCLITELASGHVRTAAKWNVQTVPRHKTFARALSVPAKCDIVQITSVILSIEDKLNIEHPKPRSKTPVSFEPRAILAYPNQEREMMNKVRNSRHGCWGWCCIILKNIITEFWEHVLTLRHGGYQDFSRIKENSWIVVKSCSHSVYIVIFSVKIIRSLHTITKVSLATPLVPHYEWFPNFTFWLWDSLTDGSWILITSYDRAFS